MVFSIVHLFGVAINVNYGRPFYDFYVELVEKVSYVGYLAWLTIGDLNGDIIPRDSVSGLRSALPIYQGRLLPSYSHGSDTVSTESFVSAYNNYVYKFNIIFKPFQSLFMSRSPSWFASLAIKLPLLLLYRSFESSWATPSRINLRLFSLGFPWLSPGQPLWEFCLYFVKVS